MTIMSLVTSFAIAVASSVVGEIVGKYVSRYGKKLLNLFSDNSSDICAPRKERCGTAPAPYMRKSPALA